MVGPRALPNAHRVSPRLNRGTIKKYQLLFNTIFQLVSQDGKHTHIHQGANLVLDFSAGHGSTTKRFANASR